MRTMLVKEILSQGGHGDEASDPLLLVTLDEATFIGLLPYRKTGA